ncbi:MAG: glutamyl-tRNA reductase [Clostridia bacterium]|jgi:glutamyl-tRNA reductase|nr:glutamyl-tRNA reductase [Clostridia bacterium]
MFIVVLGINHKTAPVEIRETLAMSKTQINRHSTQLKNLPGVEGIVILSTCNRTEFYIATEELTLGKNSLITFVANYGKCTTEELVKYIYLKESKNAVEHLFRVSSGLDSMILGESQILGQVQTAYEYSLEFKLSNSVLNTLFQQAISVGKRVRTETLIDRQSLSISSVAVDFAKELFGKLEGRSVLILGAGETSELTARYLLDNGISSVIVANRTYERAYNLAQELGGKAIRLDDFSQYLKDADIVISCTAAPKYIVEVEDLQPIIDLRINKPILFIDIAVPRDINPQVRCFENVSLYDVDDLQSVVQKNLDERRREAIQAQIIVEEEIKKFFQWLDSLFVVPTITLLKEKANYIKEKELLRAMRRISKLTDKDRKAIEILANSIVNQLLHEPIAELKRSSQNGKAPIYAEAIQTLFNLVPTEQEENHKEGLC